MKDVTAVKRTALIETIRSPYLWGLAVFYASLIFVLRTLGAMEEAGTWSVIFAVLLILAGLLTYGTTLDDLRYRERRRAEDAKFREQLARF